MYFFLHEAQLTIDLIYSINLVCKLHEVTLDINRNSQICWECGCTVIKKYFDASGGLEKDEFDESQPDFQVHL